MEQCRIIGAWLSKSDDGDKNDDNNDDDDEDGRCSDKYIREGGGQVLAGWSGSGGLMCRG